MRTLVKVEIEHALEPGCSHAPTCCGVLVTRHYADAPSESRFEPGHQDWESTIAKARAEAAKDGGTFAAPEAERLRCTNRLGDWTPAEKEKS